MQVFKDDLATEGKMTILGGFIGSIFFIFFLTVSVEVASGAHTCVCVRNVGWALIRITLLTGFGQRVYCFLRQWASDKDLS